MSLALGLLKQLYYSLVYPYITYAILACGSTHKTQNTESAVPLMNIISYVYF